MATVSPHLRARGFRLVQVVARTYRHPALGDRPVIRLASLEATRARAGRALFVPGEWADLKAPWLPIETWKLAHLVELDTTPREPCPVGGPLVLRPFADLFAAAWQRVLDGDEPRYEEVKRQKKTK